MSKRTLSLGNIVKEIARRRYNPLVLETIANASEDVIERFASELPGILKIVVGEASRLQYSGGLTRAELEKSLVYAGLDDVLSAVLTPSKGLVEKFLNDLRRLYVFKLYVNEFEVEPVLPVPWKDKIDSYTVTSVVNLRVLSHYYGDIGKGVFLSFFEGMSVVTEVIMDEYAEHGRVEVNIDQLAQAATRKLSQVYSSVGLDRVPRVKPRVFAKVLNFVFSLAGYEKPVRNGTVAISSDVVEHIAEELRYLFVPLETYYEALKEAWREYWKTLPPWYASVEHLTPYINGVLSRFLKRNVNLPVSVHLKYIRELNRLGLVEYWHGGLDPERKQWIRLRS